MHTNNQQITLTHINLHLTKFLQNVKNSTHVKKVFLKEKNMWPIAVYVKVIPRCSEILFAVVISYARNLFCHKLEIE